MNTKTYAHSLLKRARQNQNPEHMERALKDAYQHQSPMRERVLVVSLMSRLENELVETSEQSVKISC